MSDSAERLLETVEIELLKTRAGLAGVSIVHHGESADAEDSRIVVHEERDKSRDLPSAREGDPPKIMGFTITVEAITVNQAPTVIDGWVNEIIAANNDGAASSAGLTTAKAPFSPTGRVDILDPESTESEDSGHRRKRTIVYPAMARLA